MDGYFGPPRLQAEVEGETEARSAAQLADDARTLAQALPRAGYDPQREAFLQRQVGALETVARRAAGETMSLTAEVEACFDVHPVRTGEAEFRAALRQLDRLLPGSGAVRERMLAWRRRFELPVSAVLPLVHRLQAELRRRTAALVPLPDGESVSFELVSDKPWSGYNWYLGKFRSRVELSTDLPLKAHTLPGLVAHEAYPGHHTERAVKEAKLWREQGRLECSILPHQHAGLPDQRGHRQTGAGRGDPGSGARRLAPRRVPPRGLDGPG